MKKKARNKAIIIRVVIGMLILCAVPILVNMANNKETKLAKLQEPETKQASTVGTESELSDFTYTKDDTSKTVTLTEYNNTTNTSLTIHSQYSIGGTNYKTIVKISENQYYEKNYFFIGSSNLTDILFQDGVEIQNADRLFYKCIKLKNINMGNTKVTGTSMYGMFYGCTALINVDLSGLDTSSVTNMTSMFYGCTALTNVDISNLNTSKVTSMGSMFSGCSALTTINLSGLNISNVTNISLMFSNCKSLVEIQGITNLNTSNVTNMEQTFLGCKALVNLDLSGWRTSNVTNMYGIITSCTSLSTINISNWDLRKVTEGINAINFYSAGALENVDVSNVIMPTDPSYMFLNANTIKHINAKNTNMLNVTTTKQMFQRCEALINIEGTETWNMSNVTNTARMFEDCRALTSLNLNNWNTSKVTNMNSMFYGCSSLTNLDLNNWNTSNVTDMGAMFYKCSLLTSLDISDFNMTNVTSYNDVFYNCAFDTLVTPKVGKTDVSLPYRMYEENGTAYTKLPATSKTLYKEQPIKNYTVTFVNEGTVVDTQTIEEGQAATAPSLTKTGYTLSWDKSFSNVTSNITVNAVWTANTYTVTLNTNEGTINEGDVTSYTYGIGVALPTDVRKAGYVFRGWYEDEACEGTAVTSIGVTETGAKVYYAKWLKDTDGDGTPDIEDDDTQVKYTVEHYVQNTDLTTYTLQETENTLTGNLGHEVTATPKTYTGFSVVETDETVASGTVVDDGSLVLKLYYNRNTYKLPLNVDGEIEEIEYVYGEEITLPTDKEKEGYTFEGWYDNEGLTGEAVEKVDTTTIDPEDPPTYYIKWTPKEGTAYKVLHYKQEGNTNTYTLAETENLTGTTGETVTARPKTYEGYVENTTANERIPSGVVAGDGSLELVLIYDTIKLTVIFKDGDTTVDTQTIVYGENAVAPTPTKPGYILRWDKEFNNIKTNLTVNAVWLKDTDGDGIPDIEDDDTQVRYTVEHYVQNTDLEAYTLQETENTLTGNLGSTVNATPKTYTGFTLTQTDSTIANGTVVDDGSLVLKLYYNRNNYAVTLNKNEGTINSGNVLQYTYGIGVALPTNVTKEGYVFRGWYDNVNLTGTAVTAIGVTETGAKIYYASWLVDTDRDGIPDIEDDDTQVAYTVEYYKQNVEQNGYDLVEADTLRTTGHLGSNVTAEPKEYSGFIQETTENTVESGTVVDDGSLVLKLYYNRQNYGIVYETNGGTIEDKNYVTSYTYGIVVNLPTNVTKEGFTFGGWYENIVEEGARAYTRSVEEKTIVSQTKETDIGAKTYYASWNANGNTAYKVEHYKQTENGYILADTDNLTAETGANVTAVPKTYEAYEENVTHEERIASGTVAGNGSLVLKLYYDMLTYEVTFKDGETILSTQTINYGESAEAPSLTKAGYILRWDKEFSNVKTDITVNAIWLRDTDGDGIPDIEDDETLVEYIVRHYTQIGDKAEYELADTDTLQGQLGTVVTASPKTYAGYVENDKTIARIPSGELTGEGNLQLRLFYDTIKYEVTFKNGNDIVNTTKVPYGGTVEPPVIIKEGYVLSWDKSLNNITENKTINAVWTKVGETEQTYKVEHYVQTKEGKYTLKETQNLVGNIGDTVTASPKTYEEYELDETNQGTVKTGEIKEGSELTLKLYYNYKKYEVIFKDGEEEVGRVEVIHGEKATPPNLTKPGYILSWDKNINNITKEQTITAVWTVDPNYKDPNAGKDDNKPDNNNPTIDKLPDDGKEEKPSILPKTGEEVVTFGAIIGLLGIAVAYFVKYKF